MLGDGGHRGSVLDLRCHYGGDAGADVGGAGAEENLVGCLEDGVEGGGSEVQVRDVAADCNRKLKAPEGTDGFGAATPIQLDWPVADVINQLLSQLTR